MTTDPPRIPTQSSAPYVVAIVVMLAAMGGLIVWKTSGSKSDAPKAVESAREAPAVAEPAALPEDPPPPPPPPEEPAAAQVDAGRQLKKSASAAVPAAGPCGGECTGSSTPALEGQLAGLGRTARRCYDQALTNNPDLKGRIMVAVRVSPVGLVCSANIASNGTGDAALAACVAQKYRGAQLPAPQTGCVDVQVPLNFVPDNAR